MKTTGEKMREEAVFTTRIVYTMPPTAQQALRMAADVVRNVYAKSTQSADEAGTLMDAALAIEALIPVSQGDSPSAFESDQRKLGFAEGVKAATSYLSDQAEILSAHGYPGRAGDLLESVKAINNKYSTPPTDTVTMTREKFEEKLLELAEDVRLQIAKAQRSTGDYYLSMDELCAIVVQHMPKESK
jgi:hypothetical protein